MMKKLLFLFSGLAAFAASPAEAAREWHSCRCVVPVYNSRGYTSIPAGNLTVTGPYSTTEEAKVACQKAALDFNWKEVDDVYADCRLRE